MTMPEQRQQDRVQEAIARMADFAERTGLSSAQPPRRYLWTDAFAVCNFLGLARVTGEDRYLDLALRLMDQVHFVLGRHRDDDPGRGWISGLDAEQGRRHPTQGGLRIGKPLPERAPGDPMDPRLEWERDGQYFHYLTRWMQALDLAARATGRGELSLWARELAETAHAAFSYLPSGHGRPRMYWKMSIDLKRPLVSSMGQHDPLDGLVTCAQLKATAGTLKGAPASPSMAEELEDFAIMTEALELVTDDPLGLGGLLMDATRVAQLRTQGAFGDDGLLERLLDAAHAGLRHFAAEGGPADAAETRLGFRELGLAIGLEGVDWMRDAPAAAADTRGADGTLAALADYLPLGERILAFWREPAHREARSWTGHLDINEVMLASALVPEGALALPRPG